MTATTPTAQQYAEEATAAPAARLVPTIIPIETPTLGDRSYLVHDGEVAFVVDPQRDIDRVLDLAAARERSRITHVFETHIHNDYVTGGLALAEQTGAAYFVNAADQVSYARTPIRDGDEIAIGTAMRMRALATPGHTFTHLSYALDADGEPVAVFTGGSLLYGATGRPDLLGHGAHPRSGARPVRLRAPLASELPTPPRCSRPTVSAASAPPRSPTPPTPPSARRSGPTRS